MTANATISGLIPFKQRKLLAFKISYADMSLLFGNSERQGLLNE